MKDPCWCCSSFVESATSPAQRNCILTALAWQQPQSAKMDMSGSGQVSPVCQGGMWEALLSTAVLFSGASPVITLRMLRHINIQVISNRTYYRYQKRHLLPSIARVSLLFNTTLWWTVFIIRVAITPGIYKIWSLSPLTTTQNNRRSYQELLMFASPSCTAVTSIMNTFFTHKQLITFDAEISSCSNIAVLNHLLGPLLESGQNLIWNNLIWNFHWPTKLWSFDYFYPTYKTSFVSYLIHRYCILFPC